MNPVSFVLNSCLFDPKPHMTWGLILAPNMIILYKFLEGYNSLLVFEQWVCLGNPFSICGIHLGVFAIILDSKHNGAIWMLLFSYNV